MWLVAKLKKKEFSIFKQDLKNKIKSNLKFYQPKLFKEINKRNKIIKKEIHLMGNYIFIYNKDFKNKNFVNFLSTTRGLDYFLSKSEFNQSQLENFINLCKNFEDQKGYLKPNFFKPLINFKAKFLTGPFVNQVFQVIEKKENFLKIILNDLELKLTDKAKHLYQPI
tara:strand:- start:37 stop:537 length:501 start_codon:yes stop_codon:yes gene_type:complete